MTGPAQVSLNGRRVPLPPGSIESLLRGLGYGSAPPGIAVAVNGAVVPRSEWARVRLAAGDEVEIVGAVQGG